MCLFVCGPPYYIQRAVFASPLSAFFIKLCVVHSARQKLTKVNFLKPAQNLQHTSGNVWVGVRNDKVLTWILWVDWVGRIFIDTLFMVKSRALITARRAAMTSSDLEKAGREVSNSSGGSP